MLRLEELVDRVRSYKPDVNAKLLRQAYRYAEKKHKFQKRASGEPYISHPVAVAAILIDMHLDEATIIAALLHDTIEDTTATREEIDRLFGKEIGHLVEGLTKLKKLDHFSKTAIQGENLRKLLVATSEDVRILLIKLADRLHNMRTLEVIAPTKRIRIAQETLDIYAPLADRIGMRDMREELDDLSFRYLNETAYKSITLRLKYIFETNKDLLKTIEEDLTKLLSQNGIEAKVFSRQKRPYAVFHKMESKRLAFEQLSDIFGFRVIVETIEECYRVLGLIHTSWSMVPGRFKDYISTPKQNDYRSIHTTIIGPFSQRIELQIRTVQMNDIAEYGVAAHPLYKELGSKPSTELLNELNAYAWIRQTLQMLTDGDNPEEFLEHTKLELFQDQVFCFTPKGKLIALPNKATPIDFAYAIHTEIGNSCIGAKINSRTMPLITELKNGDEVEIICSDAKTPVSAWEGLVRTGKARAAIRRATRSTLFKQYCSIGQQILKHDFLRAGSSFDEEKLQEIVPRFARKNIEDLFVAIARNEILSKDVLKAMYPSYKDAHPLSKAFTDMGDKNWKNVKNAAGMMFRLGKNEKISIKPSQQAAKVDPQEHAIPINSSYGNALVKFYKDGAIPGDRIVGILQENGSIVVYPIQAQDLKNYDSEPERWIDMRWASDMDRFARFPVRIHLFLVNMPGALADVARVMSVQNANIVDICVHNKSQDFLELSLMIEVIDTKHLSHILKQIQETQIVSSANRMYS